ncbi:hypothetical protein AB0J84_31250 [Micromonospora arborensis]|uniref:hypothetical protein n=1 Tax=Micromonospora arborensis TaxID=2116518 RepID=UPI00341F0B4A
MRLTTAALGAALATGVALTLSAPAPPVDLVDRSRHSHLLAAPGSTAGPYPVAYHAEPTDGRTTNGSVDSRVGTDPTTADPTTGADHHHQGSPANSTLLAVDAALLAALIVLLARRPRIRRPTATWTYRG